MQSTGTKIMTIGLSILLMSENLNLSNKSYDLYNNYYYQELIIVVSNSCYYMLNESTWGVKKCEANQKQHC